MAFPTTPTPGQQVEEPAGSGQWWQFHPGPPPTWERIAGPAVAAGRYENTYSGATWIVGHNLGETYVSVQCVDAAGNVIIGDPAFTSTAVLTVTFSEPVTGTAVVRR